MAAGAEETPSRPSSPGPRRGSSFSSCELSVRTDPELLRAVTLSEALCGWGKHWDAENGGMPRADAANYRLSQPVVVYDAFLSHDWGSGRWLKLLSLLIVFNSGPAFCSSLLVSIAVGILRGMGVLPDELWTVIFGHVTFVLVLSFWQRIRSVCRPCLVFFDKLCVAQHDDVLLALTRHLFEIRRNVLELLTTVGVRDMP